MSVGESVFEDPFTLCHQIFCPFFDQGSLHLFDTGVKLLQFDTMLFLILESLLNHFQFVEVLNDLGFVGDALLVLQP